MVEFGKKIYPKKRDAGSPDTSSETSVEGATWSIKLVDAEYVFEYYSGSHGGGLERLVVTEQEFQDVKSGKISDNDLLLKYQNAPKPDPESE